MTPSDPRAPFRAHVLGRPVSHWLLALSALGLILRVLSALLQDGMHYPDELFQYLEPAYSKLHGHGYLAWEFERGARNWLIPWHYGALLALFDLLGLSGGALLKAIWLHNALLATLLVPLAFRLGVALSPHPSERALRVGLLSAAAAALFPTLLYFAPHSQAELHGLLLGTWAYVLWLESVHLPQRPRTALAIGLLLGAVFIARVGLAVFIPLIFADLLLRRRLRELLSAGLGFILALSALALTDLLTWGVPLNSVIEFVKFNWIEGGAANLEVQPPTYYWQTLFLDRLGPATWLLLLPPLLHLRRHWRLILTWLIPFLLLSRVGIKQERFLSTMWPFVLVAAVSGWVHLGALISRRPPTSPSALRLGTLTALAALTAVLAFNAKGVTALDPRWRASHYEALRHVGQDPDATGVLFDDSLHISGGHLNLGRHIPLMRYAPDLASEPIFSHVITDRPDTLTALVSSGDFLPILHLDRDVTLLRRRTPLIGPPLPGTAPELRLHAGGLGGEPRPIYRCDTFIGIEAHLSPDGWLQAARALCSDGPPLPWSGLPGDGPTVASTCPDGASLVGLHGRHGALLDAIGAECQDSNGRRRNVPAVGSHGGSRFYLACPSGRPISGIAFDTGALVDRVELRCGP